MFSCICVENLCTAATFVCRESVVVGTNREFSRIFSPTDSLLQANIQMQM